MKSLDLTDKLITLKIKSKTLGQIYFMSQVFGEHNYCYDKRKKKKMKTTKNYLSLLPPLSSQDGRAANSQLFSWQKFLKFFL